MPPIDEFRKEEFAQCYQQYRWLDDTRGRYAVRFWVFLVAFLGIYLLYEEKLIGLPLLVVSLIVVLVLVFITKTVLMARRQQRGHAEYLNAVRSSSFGTSESVIDIAPEYAKYVSGRRVYVTTWIELTLVVPAFLSPLLVPAALYRNGWLDHGWLFLITVAVVIAVTLVDLFFFLVRPFYRYNFAKTLNWDTD